MEIYVKLGEPLWRAIGARRLTLAWPDEAAVTVQDALARLAADYPAFAAAYAGSGLRRPYPYRVFVDAMPVEPAPTPPPFATGPNTPGEPSGISSPGVSLKDGQTLFIVLPAIGG